MLLEESVKMIDARLGGEVRELYQFGFERCDELVRKVMGRLAS